MADGALTLTLDDATVARLEQAAREAGIAPEAYAAELVAESLAPGEGPFAEAERRLAEYDRTGESVDAEAALAEFVAAVEARAAQRA